MKRLLCLSGVLMLLMHPLSISPTLADEDDLSNGVFIAHHPPGIQFTDPPPEGWCQHYLDNFAIYSCDEQNPRITDRGIERQDRELEELPRRVLRKRGFVS